MTQGLSDFETAITAADMLDQHNVDWQRVQRTTYLIHQCLCYEYPGPINDLNQRLAIIPPEQYADQHRIAYRLEVSTPTAEIVDQDDAFGNKEINLCIPYIERTVEFEAWILVERYAQNTPHYLSAASLSDARFLEPSALTQPDDSLRQTAACLLAEGKQGLELAQQINDWVYRTVSYAHDVTDIHTTAAEVLALKQGVCQDYAHLMLALCRLCGLPARYVSGHLLGEGGTHAWVEVLVPVAGQPALAQAVPFDPTHGRQAGLTYLTISVGRDYFDVAPTSGTFRAAYGGQLSTSKRVRITHLEYANTIQPE
jgi:transglutaminase-like putative cysteine protease